MEFKNINTALIPVICFACMIIMGCSGNVIPPNNAYSNKTNQFTCPSNNYTDIHTKLSAFAEGQPLPSVDWCYCYNATENKNYNEAVDLCISAMGSYGNDSSICMRVNRTSYRDFCLLFVAERSKNSSACGAIENESTRQKCYSDVK